MNNNTNKNNNPRAFLDVSRFTRWVNRLDEKDKSLRPRARKKMDNIPVYTVPAVYSLLYLVSLHPSGTKASGLPGNRRKSQKKYNPPVIRRWNCRQIHLNKR